MNPNHHLFQDRDGEYYIAFFVAGNLIPWMIYKLSPAADNEHAY
jgi:hypothetical protein